jgi:hypothetical protein
LLKLEGHSFQVPPERLPRRAVRGLGAQSPHQTGPLHPLKMSRSQIVTGIDWPCEVKTLLRSDNLGCKQAVSGVDEAIAT